jgi:hypothetical protein
MRGNHDTPSLASLARASRQMADLPMASYSCLQGRDSLLDLLRANSTEPYSVPEFSNKPAIPRVNTASGIALREFMELTHSCEAPRLIKLASPNVGAAGVGRDEACPLPTGDAPLRILHSPA